MAGIIPSGTEVCVFFFFFFFFSNGLKVRVSKSIIITIYMFLKLFTAFIRFCLIIEIRDLKELILMNKVMYRVHCWKSIKTVLLTEKDN